LPRKEIRKMNENKTRASKKNTLANQGKLGKMKSVLDGSILVREKILTSIPFILFVALMAGLLITNTYMAERNARKVEQLTKQMVELRIKHKLTKSELMYVGSQSEIVRKVASRGLIQSTVPPTRVKRSEE